MRGERDGLGLEEEGMYFGGGGRRRRRTRARRKRRRTRNREEEGDQGPGRGSPPSRKGAVAGKRD